ncbi:MAG: S1 RNA-binding domain-containing protein [Patescibacteria group bacterium]
MKALKPDPWKDFASRFKKGDILKGKIRKVDRFGAFVEVSDFALSGLAHVSEFGSEKAMRESVAVGNTYHFQILSLNPEERKLSLSFVKESGVDV